MNSQPEVSVIIPTYNRANVIGRSIQSVLAQTYRNFELIIVDDGSNDNTEEVVGSFNDTRIRFIRQEINVGQCTARNIGIKAARGEYVVFLDSDDEFAPEKLEKQFAALRFNGSSSDIIVTGLLYKDDSTTKRRKTPKQVLRPCPSGNISDVFFNLGKNGITNVATMMVRRESLHEVGLFDQNLPASEFWDLGNRLARKFQFRVVEDPLYIVHRDKGPRAWNPDNRIKAMPHILSKYSQELANKPRTAARFHLIVGVLQLKSGLRKEGQRAILKAWRLNPYTPMTYMHLLCSVLPSGLGRKLLK